MARAATEFRILTASDLAVLERVDDDVFDNPVQSGWATQYLSSPGNLLVVAVEEGVVVGMASAIAYLHPDKPLQLFINEVGVAERCRGQGIGKRLMQVLLEHGSKLGCVEAWVATEAGNAPARALYEATNGAVDREAAVIYTWKLK